MLKDIKKLGPQSTKNYYKYRMPEFNERETFIKQKNQIKNQHYYADTTNVWNNYSRLSDNNKVFLYLEKNEKIDQQLIERKINIQEEKKQEIAQRVQSAKYETHERFLNRQYKQAALQKESEQVLDDKQYQMLEKKDPKDYFQVRKQIWHHNKDAKINNKQPENGWNMLKNTSTKNVKTVFTETVVKKEEEGIKLAKQKIKEEIDLENKIQEAYNKRRHKIRQEFLNQHKQNLEKEKQLKIGVFGEYKKQGNGKYEIIQKIPETINKPFPTKYNAVLQKSTINKNSNSERDQFFSNLAQPKKPEDTLEYQDFRGLFLADCDKKTVIQENDIIKAYKDTFVYKKIQDKLQRPTTGGYRNNQVTIRRPQSCKPLKGADYQNYEKSINFLNEKDKTEKDQVINELDEFDKNLKSKKEEVKKGFSKVSQIEYEHLSTTKGFFKVKQLKSQQNYPKCYSGKYNPDLSIKRNNFVQSQQTELEFKQISGKQSQDQTFKEQNQQYQQQQQEIQDQEQEQDLQNENYDNTFQNNENNNELQQSEIKVNDQQNQQQIQDEEIQDIQENQQQQQEEEQKQQESLNQSIKQD